MSKRGTKPVRRVARASTTVASCGIDVLGFDNAAGEMGS
jgi:hypothetical protein